MKTRLWLFLTAFALVFSACDKDDEFRGNPNRGDFAHLGDNYLIASVDGVAVTDLIAGQDFDNPVGTVTVKFDDEDNIVVTYKTDAGWFITETHLHIAEQPGLIPTNNGGNPRIGHFDNGEEGLFDSEVSYTIPYDKEWDCYYIAAHAVVTGGEGEADFESIAEMLPGTADISVTAPSPGGSTYFPNINIDNGGELNGDYPGWCLEPDIQIANGTFDVFSSVGDLPSGYPENFFNKVNWILNQKFVGTESPIDDTPDFTYGDVQIAIWVLKLEKLTFEDARNIIDDAALNPQYIGGYNPENIDYIVAQANIYGHDFEPDCDDDILAIIFTNADNQDIIIEYPVPCKYGDETAWGQGCLFNDKSWAMYFKVCP